MHLCVYVYHSLWQIENLIEKYKIIEMKNKDYFMAL